MMRHVVAVLMTIALVSVAMPVIDDVASDRSQQALETELTKVQEAAESLSDDEEQSGGSTTNPRRVVTLDFPDKSFTSRPVETIRISPQHGAEKTVVTYAVAGRQPSRMTVDAVVVGQNNGTVELGGHRERQFVLELKRDAANNRVVEFRRMN